MSKQIYYVSYGSNILYDRFKLYIEGGTNETYNITQVGCIDKTLPQEIRQYIIPHDIYFANNSSKWDQQGVAFLDVSKSGFSLGKAYLITEEQFKEVHRQEGNHQNWYNHAFYLGTLNNIEVWTITNDRVLTYNKPSQKYIDVIIKGITETYPQSTQRDNYIQTLKKAYL